ncbi:MAG: hypothetical protein ABI548_11055 [Polyangiaceae bacterium]
MSTRRPESEPQRPSWRIDVGPLPARWGRAGFALLFFVLSALSVLCALRTTRLECQRDLQQEPSCTLSDSPPLPTVDRFPPGSIARVAEEHESSGKGPGYWAVLILNQRGAERSVASYDSQEGATALGDRIRAYLADGRVARFSFASAPNYAKGALLSTIALLLVGLLMRNAFHQAGHLLLDIDRSHDELRVRRKLFGVPRGRPARFALADLSDVQLERGPVLDKLLTRGQLPATGARFVLVRARGHRYPLTPDYLPGPALFEQGLELLRAELGFVSQTEDAETEDAETEDGARHAGPSQQGAAQARSWIATFTGSVAALSPPRLAIAIVAVAAIGSVLLVSNANRGDGALEIRAEYRCMFDGIDILPGGDMSMRLKPGRYEIRVFNSAAPGGWESQFYTLNADQSVLVRCRPLRAAR